MRNNSNSTNIQKVWTWTKIKTKPVKLLNKLSTNCTLYGSIWNMDARQEAVTHTTDVICLSVFSRNPGSASLHTRREIDALAQAHIDVASRDGLALLHVAFPSLLRACLGIAIYGCLQTRDTAATTAVMLLLPILLTVTK